MSKILEEFKNKVIKDIEENPRLLALDAKISELETKIKGVEFQEELFFLRKRLTRIEINKYGYSLDTIDDNDGKNN